LGDVEPLGEAERPRAGEEKDWPRGLKGELARAGEAPRATDAVLAAGGPFAVGVAAPEPEPEPEPEVERAARGAFGPSGEGTFTVATESEDILAGGRSALAMLGEEGELEPELEPGVRGKDCAPAGGDGCGDGLLRCGIFGEPERGEGGLGIVGGAGRIVMASRLNDLCSWRAVLLESVVEMIAYEVAADAPCRCHESRSSAPTIYKAGKGERRRPV
jgi:hypothetical protein